MNRNVLQKDIQDFIHSFPVNDLHTLVLKGSPFESVLVQELAVQIESLNVMRKKVPLFSAKGFLFPRKLNVEQTSSQETALYKQSIIGETNSFIDCTGGFGVDTFFIAQKSKKAIYCELNEDLVSLVQHNFKQINAKIEVLQTNGIDFLSKTEELFDVVYLDPSRRAKTGKVISLEQSQPNILNHWNLLLEKANRVVVKLSPMLDINYLIRELPYINEVHIVSVKNDVKEILVLASKKKKAKRIKLYSAELNNQNVETYTSGFDDDLVFPQIYSAHNQEPLFLYEPLGCLLKANLHDKYAAQNGLFKLAPKSNFFLSNERFHLPLMKHFEVDATLSFKRKEILDYLSSKRVNVVTRNFPLKPEAVLKKLKIKQGGDKYLLCSTDKESNLVCFIANRI